MKNILFNKKQAKNDGLVKISIIILFVSTFLLPMIPNKVSALTSSISSTILNMEARNPGGDCSGSSCSSSIVPSNSSSGSSLISQITSSIDNMEAKYPGGDCGGVSCVTHTTVSSSSTPTYSSPPVTPPTLNASCSVSRTRINAGDSVTFNANITGGTGSYSINWYGDVNRISGFNRTRETQSVRINDAGRYYISLEVTDSLGRRSTHACPVIVADEDPIDDDINVQCDISRSTINAGDYVDIEVFTSGGTRPYYIDWSGDARLIRGFNRTRESQRVRINDTGTYRLRVDVEDRRGNTGTDYCTVRVRSAGGTGTINVYSGTTPPDGELAGISSIYLNQVPYTGPGDVLKVIGFLAFIFIWSVAIATYFLKGKKKKEVSNRISAFKEANKVKVLAE